MELKVNMEWILLAVGLLVGSGSTWGIMKNRPPKIVETNKVIEKMVEVDKNLTDTDLLKIPCSLEFLKENGSALCRELYCRMSTRGGATQQTATSKECEAIGNILNKDLILKICSKRALAKDLQAHELEAAEKDCISFFDRRI